MKKIAVLILCLNSWTIFAQQSGTFYFSIHGDNCDKNFAKTKLVISKIENNTFKEYLSVKIDNRWEPQPNYYTSYTYENDSVIIINDFYNNKICNTKRRIYKKQNNELYSFVDVKNDTITMKGTALSLLPFKLDGEVIDYYKNGSKRSETIYKNNRIVSNKRWKENGENDISNVFQYEEVEIEPKFKDGSLSEFIHNEIKYPEEALKKHIKGRVTLQMIVMEDGSVDGVKIITPVHPLLDNEAVRVLMASSKKWNPAKIDNSPVRVSYYIPINFEL